VLEITAEILEAAASSYHEDRWELQEVRVVVVCTARTAAAVRGRSARAMI
jgi:hypothetical protein